MTGPAVGPRLAAVAAWDVPLLRGAVVTMEAMAGRLRSWCTRLDGVGRSLESEQAWSGPAARSAVVVLREVSAAAWAADLAVAESATAFRRLADEAAAAQSCAARAVALADDRLLEAVVADVGARQAATDAALQHATAAAAAADDADTALAGIAIIGDPGPADLGVLAGAGEVVAPPDVPAGRPPGEVAAWWAALPASAQLALLERVPSALGGLDGLPGWARDRANRRLLAQALDDPGLPRLAQRTAGVVAERIRAEEAAGEQVQLHLLDLEEDRVAVALGDVDTADAVALLVPGIGNSPADDLDGLIGDAWDVADAAGVAAPGLSVATVVWLGYRTPHSLRTTISRASAWQGGPTLAAGLAGLAEARAASGQPPPRTTVLAHSYGTVVVDEAADVSGALDADAVVLLGSPGMEGRAADLEAPEVYDVASAADLVTYLGWYGVSTRADGFGSTELPRDPGTGHSDYYQPGSATLAELGEVVTGPWTSS